MASNDLINAFHDCLGLIEQGQTLDQAIRRYPQFADDLRVLLTARDIVPRYELPVAEVTAARSRIQPLIDQIIDTIPERRSRPWLIPLLIVVLVLVVILVAWLLGGRDDAAPEPTLTVPAVVVTVTLEPSASVPSATWTPAPSLTLTQTAAPTIPATDSAPVCSQTLVLEGVIESVSGTIVTIYGLQIQVADASGLLPGVYARVEGCQCDDDDACGDAGARATLVVTPSQPPPPSGGNDDDDDAGGSTGGGQPGGGMTNSPPDSNPPPGQNPPPAGDVDDDDGGTDGSDD